MLEFNHNFISFQNSIEWYKDSLQGPILLKTDENNFFHKVTTYSNDLSFGKEVTFESISLVDKGRYICRVHEKVSPYHHQPGKKACTIERKSYKLLYKQPSFLEETGTKSILVTPQKNCFVDTNEEVKRILL